MTREQTEKKIRDKFAEILKIYKEYDPEGDYLITYYCEDCISFNNRYWESEKEIKYFERFEGKN